MLGIDLLIYVQAYTEAYLEIIEYYGKVKIFCNSVNKV